MTKKIASSSSASSLQHSLDKSDEDTSKMLSMLLRTTAPDYKIKLTPQGFAFVDEILKLRRFQLVTEADVQRIVDRNDKQRFSLQKDEEGRLQIRANQGHTIPGIVPSLHKIDEHEAETYINVIHGTNEFSWRTTIRFEGLHRVTRNHIHFAHGKANASGAVPGVRTDATIHIYLDLVKAVKDGYEFYLSENKVLLTPGDKDGLLPRKYFSKVINLETKEELTDFSAGEFKRADHLVSEVPSELFHATLQRNVHAVRIGEMRNTLGPHVHFTAEKPQPGPGVEVIFDLDMEKVHRDGLKFYQYEKDGFFLFPGTLAKHYFKRVVDMKTGKEMFI